MARKSNLKSEDVRDKSAPYASFGPKKGKRLLKVCSAPPTWVEVDINATEEQIAQKIADYKSKNPSLSELVHSAEFEDLRKDDAEPKEHKKKFDYSGPIYHIPKINPHMFK